MKKSFIDLINIVGTFLIVCVIAFAVYTLFVDKPFFEASSYEEGEYLGSGDDSGTYSSDKPVDRVSVKNVSGRIEVEGWANDWVQLDYIKRGPGGHPDVKIDLSGSSLDIRAVYPKRPGNFGSVDFFLKVPENIAELTAGSVSGRIEVSGLGEDVREELSSTSGSISTDAAGELEISSVSGSLDFSATGPDIKASTTSGRIEGRLIKASESGEIKLKSVSGRVSLDVPSDINADVDLHSVSGSVSSDLPISVTETKKNSIRGVIGNGGTIIEMSTVSGSVKITE